MDEGTINIIFYYIAFFKRRKSNLWIYLVKHLLTLYTKIINNNLNIHIVLLPKNEVNIARWIQRGDFPNLNKAIIHLVYYKKLFKIIKNLYDNKANVKIFDNIKNSLDFVLNHIIKNAT